MPKSAGSSKPKPQNDARGRPGGDESKARLLACAGELFAERGFNGVSTRELATAADANVSAIGYYFRGKKGLYRAVVNQVIEDTQPFFGPTADRVREGVDAAAGDRRQMAALTRWLIRTLLQGVLREGPMRWQIGLMLREFHQPADGFPILLERRIHPMHDAVAGLVGAAIEREPKEPETLLLTCCLIGQCMAFGAAQGLVLARLGWSSYSEENLSQVIDTVTHVGLSMLGLEETAA